MLTIATRSDYVTLLDADAWQDSDAIALTFVASTHEPISVTRRQFKHHALRYGYALSEIGITSGEVVIIACQNILDSIYAFWGVMAIGAIPSMFPTRTEKLNPQMYQQNLATLIALSDVRAVITDDEFVAGIADLSCPILTATQLDEHQASIYTPSPEKIALLQHSSGTTGLQKGVALSHEAVLNQLASYSDALTLTREDVIVSWLPLYHDMGLIAGFLLPLMQGIPLVLMSPFDWIVHPALLLKTIDSYQGTLCWLPNFAYQHMARRIRKRDKEGLSLASMRAFINCSEPVRADSHSAFLETFSASAITAKQLAVSYAMAENTFAVTQTAIGEIAHIDSINQAQLEQAQIADPDPHGIPFVSCGQAIAHTAIRIVGDDFTELPERSIGEVMIQSDCMLRDYYHRPDLQPFVTGWYQTGDMGYIANGELYIIGRKKDIIIHAGKNVYPQDIEAIVDSVVGVYKGRCVVFGVFDEREGTERIAVVAEQDPDYAHDLKTLKKQIRQRIAQYSTVSASYVTIVRQRWLIKTSSGKIARLANREKWLSEFAP